MNHRFVISSRFSRISVVSFVREAVSRRCAWTALCLVGFSGMFFWLADGRAARNLRDLYAVHKSLDLRLTLGVIKSLGKAQCLILLALVIGLSGRKRMAIDLLLALILVTLMVLPIKVIVHRQRPRGHNYLSFPSGDAAAAASQATVLAATGLAGLITAAGAALAVGTARIVVGAHYPSDVLFGFTVGILAGCLAPALRKGIGLRIRYHYLIGLLFLGALIWMVTDLTVGPNKDLNRFVSTFWSALILVGSLRALRRFAYRP